MSAEQNINPQDYELLSAYIDGELSDPERLRLEQRLVQESFLEQELNSLRSTVSLIHSLELMTAPRDFTLTDAMVNTAPKIIPFKPRRQMRSSYLSMVASIMLMLFGALFMLTELNSNPNFSTMASSAPIQSDSASQKVAPSAIASVPTALTGDANLESEELIEEPVILGANAVEETEEIAPEDSAVFNMQAPVANQSDSEFRQDDFGGDSTEIASDEMFYSIEAPSMANSTVTDTDGYAMGGEAQLLDTLAEDGTLAQDAPAPMVASGLAQTEAVNDSIITDTEIAENDNARDDVLDEAQSDDSSEAVGRIMSQATEIPPSPVPAEESLKREELAPTQASNNLQIGMGLLIIGFALLITSILFIRRNRI